jgi:hypothetical protein
MMMTCLSMRQVPGEQFGLFDVGFIGELQRRFLEVLAVQPPAVFLRPSGHFGVADAMAEPDGVHVLAACARSLAVPEHSRDRSRSASSSGSGIRTSVTEPTASISASTWRHADQS